MADPFADELTIRAGGKTLGGWQKVRVSRSVEAAASDVEITMTDVDPKNGRVAALFPGNPCEVYLGPDKAITGYIDRLIPEYDKDSHQVTLIARSKTSDIVDCSIDIRVTGWVFAATTIGDAAKRLAKPYSLEVSLPDGDADLPIRYFPIAPGETAFALLEEMARTVGMLVWDDAAGRLVISKGGTFGRASGSLVEGQNVEVARAELTIDQRFKDYLVLAQARDVIQAFTNGRGLAHDPGVQRNRLKVILQEVPAVGDYSQRRADWEASRRLGRSRLIRIRTTGWRQGDGSLWRPNQIVGVKLPKMRIEDDFAVAQVSWLRSEAGTQTDLVLMPPQGFQPEPLTFLPWMAGVDQPAPR